MDQLSWVRGLPCSVVDKPVTLHQSQLQMTSRWGGTLCLRPPLRAGVFEPVQVICVPTQPLCVHGCHFCCDGKMPCPWSHSEPLPPLPHRALSLERWDLVLKKVPSKPECSKVSHSLHIILLGTSFLVTVDCKKKFLYKVQATFYSVGIAICHKEPFYGYILWAGY